MNKKDILSKKNQGLYIYYEQHYEIVREKEENNIATWSSNLKEAWHEFMEKQTNNDSETSLTDFTLFPINFNFQKYSGPSVISCI